MPESRSERALVSHPTDAVEPTVRTREERLAALLADMVPGTRTIRVSQYEPGQTWPSPYARAYDARGRLIPINRAQRLTAARWVIRAHPEVYWEEAYDLNITTGILRPAAEAYSAAGGGC
ncbi:hypothetical protein [Streptomyces sp. R41]|uniref:Transcriptional regulator n=1 Tax=Streptomyces sp. R41 TaxID=3238632 RepID=A0AB39RT66_9ACTN